MKRFAVIGLGRFGRAVATTLFELGVEVMAIDKNKQLVNGIQDEVSYAVALDATDRDLLKGQEVDKVDCAVVGIGENFEANVLVTSILREFGVRLVITRAYNDLQRQILRSVGAAQVLTPEEDMGRRLARSLVTGEIVDFLELPKGFAVKLIPAPKSIVGKTLAESKIRSRYLIDIVVIRRKKLDESTKEMTTEAIVIPDGSEEIVDGDILGVIGKAEDIERFV